MTDKTFKLTKSALAVIQNFSRFNEDLIFRPGKLLNTVSKPEKDIFGVARLDCEIPDEFAIARVPKFLNVLGLYDDPELSVDAGKRLIIKGKNQRKFSYTLANEKSLLVLRKDWTPPELKVNASFSLTGSDLIAIKKSISVAELTEVVFRADGKKLWVEVTKLSDPTFDNYSAPLGETKSNFNLAFVDRKINVLMEQDYDVSVMGKIVKFSSERLDYYIAAELGSSIE